MNEKTNFWKDRIRSIGFAAKGAWLLMKTEASIQIQVAIAILVTVAGIYFRISSLEWILQIFAIAMVMSIEGLNTAVEKISDFVHPDQHRHIGFIKDISAGAVFIAAVGATSIGVIIYFPKIS